MPATIVEVAVLRLDSLEDAKAAMARLEAVGPVVLLRGLRSDSYSVRLSAGADAGPESWTDEYEDGASHEPRADAARKADARAVARLDALQQEYDADWLIASEATLRSARACTGLRVICLGPGDDGGEPTRPDHRAHSLLDAARFIETSAAFA